jgi:DNA-binding NarL/FixJ family response regulator
MLTGSEIEVGWLLLKGLSLKEIAIVRSTQEKTVRQQASSIDSKPHQSIKKRVSEAVMLFQHGL